MHISHNTYCRHSSSHDLLPRKHKFTFI